MPVQEKTYEPLSVLARRQSSRLGTASLLLLSSAMLWVGIAVLEAGEEFAPWEASTFVFAGVLATCAYAASALLLSLNRRGVLLGAVIGVVASSIPFGMRPFTAPAVVFLVFSWAAALLYWLLRLPPLLRGHKWISRDDDIAALLSPSVLFTSAASLLLSGLAFRHGVLDFAHGRAAVLALLMIPTLVATLVEWFLVRHGRFRVRMAVALSLLTAAACVLTPWPAIGFTLLALRVAAALIGALSAHELYPEVLRYLWHRPAVLVVLTFLFLSFAGGLFLTFPACTTRPLDDLDALFTAVSASCVTGLIVLDTPVDFTFFGQCVILILIQVGALGIMTLSAVATMVLGRTIGAVQGGSLQQVVGTATPAATIRLIRTIAVATLTIETAGTGLLVPAFVNLGMPIPEAVWKGVFHSVSAFCNAGFALQSDSLVAFHGHPYIVQVISLLIMLGGIGFGVLAGVFEFVTRRARRLSLHAKLVLVTSALLWVGSWMFFAATEWNGALSGQTTGEKMTNSWMQAVTLRTAGFNSVDLTQLGAATLLLMMFCMFVGASPASTGGGVKTTTLALLALAVRAVVKQTGDVQAFGRRIPPLLVYRAAAVVTLSGVFILFGGALLMITQDVRFDHALFEAVSAFGTVGLSLGVTEQLDSVGKVIVITLMFAGRTGPLTMVLLFLQQTSPRIRYPQEEVMVG